MRGFAHLALIVAAVFWGFGNIAQKTVLEHVGPMSATCLRCGIAALVIIPFIGLDRRLRRESGWLASALFVAATFAAAISIQQTAYLSSTVTNASFLVNTATILTPLLAWLILQERTGIVGIAAAAVTMVGVFLMSNGMNGFAAFKWGDAACLVSAFFYALWMVLLGRHAHRYGSPFATAFVQFSVACLMTMAPMIVSEAPPLASIVGASSELLALGVFSTAAAFCLQIFAQRYTTASRAALLVSGESVFGALGAFLWLDEQISIMVATGAALILIAIVTVAFMPITGSAKVTFASPH